MIQISRNQNQKIIKNEENAILTISASDPSPELDEPNENTGSITVSSFL